jgi:hypothetical protein
MKRREAIQTIVMATAATIFLPACAGRGAFDQIADGRLLLDRGYMTYLARISQSILPVHGISDKIPNAVNYIMTMLNDCGPVEDIPAFARGFDQFMALVAKARMDLVGKDTEEVAAFIASVYARQGPPSELIRFIDLVKELSIENLVTSEYYQAGYEGYLLIPEPYIACQKPGENG